MASEKLTSRLSLLITAVGGSRKAEALIRAYKGVSPTQSALYKASKGSTTDYIATCYIEDLERAIKAEKGDNCAK
ncbi:hypothetical protein [Photobacterium damselae]|uniref:hypothetical protein n=1 Tax=Photobacterium damselae TaxID=38293 RepID=UPI0040686E27